MSLNLELEVADKPRANPLDLKKNPLLISILEGCETLKNLAAKDLLPLDYVTHSKGLLFMKIDKIGLGFSITQGYGLVLAKAPQSPYGWSPPLPIKVDGFSLGAVIGYNEQHTVIALALDNDIQAFLKDKRAMKIGMDFGLQLMSQVDKSNALSSQTAQKNADSGLSTKAFTLSRGIMVDVSFQGTSVEPDSADIASAYGDHVTPGDILTGKVAPPREALLLYSALRDLTQGPGGASLKSNGSMQNGS